MQITGKLTTKEIVEVRRIFWAPHYYLNLFNNYFMRGHTLHLIGIVLILSILTSWINQKTIMNPLVSTSLACILGVGCITYLLVRWHRLPSKAVTQINTSMPRTIEINEEGVGFQSQDGIKTLIPWKAVKGWRSGNVVAILDLFEEANVLVLPLEQLQSEEQAIIRSILQHRLGNPTVVLLQAKTI